MKKVTYYMYSCDTCCIISEDGNEWLRLSHVSKNPQLKDKMGILQKLKTKIDSEWLVQFLERERERESSFSIDFPPF